MHMLSVMITGYLLIRRNRLNAVGFLVRKSNVLEIHVIFGADISKSCQLHVIGTVAIS